MIQGWPVFWGSGLEKFHCTRKCFKGYNDHKKYIFKIMLFISTPNLQLSKMSAHLKSNSFFICIFFNYGKVCNDTISIIMIFIDTTANNIDNVSTYWRSLARVSPRREISTESGLLVPWHLPRISECLQNKFQCWITL
jgi:hypothetical protein